jgi:hypothetical protein
MAAGAPLARSVITFARATIAIALAATAAAATIGLLAQELGESRTILLSVSDARDRAVIDLLPDDFIVQEDGETRDVLTSRLADYPIVLMIDNGGGMPGDFDPLRRAAVRFIERVGPRPIVLGRISNPPALMTALDDARDTVLEALDTLEMTPARSSPVQGIVQAASMLSELGLPFSTIVVLSAESIETSQTSTVNLARVLSSSHARLYVVIHRRGMRDRSNLDFLGNLSEQTGGQYIPIYSAASFEPAVDRVADRLLAEILVEFLEPPGTRPTGDVRVGVRRPGAKVKGLGITPP